MKTKSDDEYGAEETARRLEAAIKRSLQTKPQPRKPKGKPGKPTGRAGVKRAT